MPGLSFLQVLEYLVLEIVCQMDLFCFFILADKKILVILKIDI